MKLIQPYTFLGLTLKEYYERELEDKTAKHIYLHYEHEGKNYMKQLPYFEAKQIIDEL